MKLMEAGAVFLIIGGVLLGPIERRTIQGWGWDKTLACLGEKSDDPLGRLGQRKELCREKSLEPIAKTCEQAMREIGAFLAPPGVPPGFRPEDESKTSPGDEWRLIGGEKVLCIPAPSGLVR